MSYETHIPSKGSLENEFPFPLVGYYVSSLEGELKSTSTINKLGVSKNNGTPKSSILIGFSIINTIHFGVPFFLETPNYDL